MFCLWCFVRGLKHDLHITKHITAGNRHTQNSWFCKEIREDNFRFWWRRVHEDVSQGQKLKFSFLMLEYYKIRECYAVANAFTIRNMYSLFLYMTLAKWIVPRKTWRKLWHSCISKLFLTKMQAKFSIFFHHGSLNVIGDKFRFVRSNWSLDKSTNCQFSRFPAWGDRFW
jgi:hypothetical protein